MLLNIGTAQRVMGQMDKAESNYEEAYAIFKEKLHEPDYRMATLYNNRSILYANTGRLKEAKAESADGDGTDTETGAVGCGDCDYTCKYR